MRHEDSTSPQSYFDVVSILQGAPASILPMSVVELHLYAYLGCVLALFRGSPVSDWGYHFSVTSEGFPFSVELDAARKVALVRGLAQEDAAGLIETDVVNLAREFTILSRLSSLSGRVEWLRAATNCALAFPVGVIRYAINQTPGMAVPVSLGQRGTLFQDSDVALLYDEYKAVKEVLGPEVEDLLSPAVLWLSARVLRSNEVPSV